MAQKKTNIMWVLLIIGVVIFFMYKGNFKFSGTMAVDSAVTRAAPPSITAGQVINVIYTTSGVSGKWATSVQDSVSGTGCTALDNFNFVIASEAVPNACVSPCTRRIQTTSSTSSCTISSGTYQFGDFTPQSIAGTAQVTVGSSCKTAADTNCNQIVDWNEINAAISKWLQGTYTWNEINQMIAAWLS